MNYRTLIKWSAVGLVPVAGIVLVALSAAAPAQAASSAGIGLIWPPEFEGQVDHQQLLADALGISVAELEQAQEAAFEAVISAEVEAGNLTQEQADQILGGERRPMPGYGVPGFGFHRGWLGPGDPYHQLLADKLDITLDELQDALLEAHAAAIEQLVDEGVLTEQQAELARASAELRAYIDPHSMIAEALGLSVEALEQAREQGKTLSELVEERGLDSETFEQNLAEARELAVAQAVEAGVITQEQADQLEDWRGPGLGIGPRTGLQCGQWLDSGLGSGRRFGADHGSQGGKFHGPWRSGPAAESQDV